jgi:two-component system chemotaxis response regulator CheY
MKILVVDDMPLMRHVLINMLRNLKYLDLVEATDGIQALTLLKKQPFDLVITDLYMPKMDGKDLLNRMRNDEQLTSIPVLMVTCEDNSKAIKNVIAAKVSGIIVKPFSLKVLSDHLDRVLAAAHKP